MASDFQYDVAFSFLEEDEGTARVIAERLRGSRSVFIYSERQKELVGKDGQDQFTRVFREESRVVVVLYREGWGDTNWTRVEETAIKDRAFESGWDFLVVVSVDGSTPPAWLPRTKIWLGLERFGIDAAVGIVDARIRETGGEVHQETAAQKAERLAREAKARADRERILNSKAGVDLARKALDTLMKYLEDQAEAMTAIEGGTPVTFARRRENEAVFVIRTPRASITLGWAQQYSNSLKYSSLLVRTLDGPYHFDGWGSGPAATEEDTAHFTLDPEGTSAWQLVSDPTRYYSTESLGEKLLNDLLEQTYDNEYFGWLGPHGG